MIAYLFRLIRIMAIFWVRNRAVKAVKVEAAKKYLEGVRAIRQIVAVIIILIVSVMLFVLASTCLIAGVMMYFPWDQATKAIILISVGGIGVLTALFIVLAAYSERRWMKIFGVDRI